MCAIRARDARENPELLRKLAVSDRCSTQAAPHGLLEYLAYQLGRHPDNSKMSTDLFDITILLLVQFPSRKY